MSYPTAIRKHAMTVGRVAPARCRAGAPSEPGERAFPAPRLKQAAGALRVGLPVPAVLAGLEPAVAGGVYQACSVAVRRAGLPVVGEIVGGYRPAGNGQPPPFPGQRGLGWLVGDEEVVTAERTVAILLGEQAQVEGVQRWCDSSAPGGPVVGQSGSSGEAPPMTIWCRTMFVQENLTRQGVSPRSLVAPRSPNTHRSFLNLLNLPK